MRRAEQKVQQFGKKTEAIGKAITRNITLPVLGIGVASVKMAAEVESSFTKIETLVGLSGDAVNAMREDVSKLSRETGRSTKELADALFTVTSAGLRGAESLEVLDQAAKASAIGLGETKDIARATTAVLQAYGKENISASRATNILLATVREGNLEASALAPVLGRVIGVASQLGISFEEVGASVATFTRLGVSSEQAITGLRGILNVLMKQSPQAATALGSVGMSFDDLLKSVRERGLAEALINLVDRFEGNEEALARVIPEIEALSAVLGTAGAQGEAYVKVLEGIKDETDKVAEGMDRISEDSLHQFNLALNDLREIGIEIGTKVMPIAVKLAEKVRALADRFTELSDSQVMARIKITLTAAALGPLLVGVGKLIVLLPKVAKAWRAMSFTIASTGIGALVIATAGAVALLTSKFISWRKQVDFAKNSTIDLADAQQKLNEKLENTKKAYTDIVIGEEKSFDLTKLSLSALKEQVKLGEDLIKTLKEKNQLQGAKDVEDQLAAIREQIKLRENQNLIETSSVGLIAQVNEKIQKQKAIIEAALPGQEERIRLANIEIGRLEAWRRALEDLNGEMQKMQSKKIDGGFEFDSPTFELEGMSPAMIARTDEARRSYDALTESIKRNGETYVNFGQVAQDAMMQGVNSITSGIEGLIAGTSDVDSVFKGLIDVVASFMQALGKALIASAIASEAFKDLLLTNPAAAALAGGALIAASAIVRGLLKQGPEAPALAGGGLAYGATMAVVGDNVNAGVDPEVIAPLSKLQSMMGSVTVRGELRARGRDLYTVFEKEQNTRSRN